MSSALLIRLSVLAICIKAAFAAACCPVGGTWSEWAGDISTCPDYCGGAGTHRRFRICMSEPNGCPCDGESIDEFTCDPTPCLFPRQYSCAPGKAIKLIDNMILCALPTDTDTPPAPVSADCTESCPDEGIWSEWTTKGVCSATCGLCGTVQRSRTCLSERYGCPCVGAVEEAMPCASFPCPSGQACCSGAASQYNPTTGVYECRNTNPTAVTQPTMTTSCPPDGMGLWNEWTSWTTCSASCGMCGQKSRSRTCASQVYGCPCSGLPVQTMSCGGMACEGAQPCCDPAVVSTSYEGMQICLPKIPIGTPDATPAAPLPGTFTHWAPVSGSSCNDTCGGCGVQQMSRLCLPPGSECSGPFTESQPCNMDLCLFPRPTCCGGRKKSLDSVQRKYFCTLETTTPTSAPSK